MAARASRHSIAPHRVRGPRQCRESTAHHRPRRGSTRRRVRRTDASPSPQGHGRTRHSFIEVSHPGVSVGKDANHSTMVDISPMAMASSPSRSPAMAHLSLRSSVVGRLVTRHPALERDQAMEARRGPRCPDGRRVAGWCRRWRPGWLWLPWHAEGGGPQVVAGPGGGPHPGAAGP